MPLIERRADRFQRALTGPAPTDRDLAELTGIAVELSRAGGTLPLPRADFVRDLGGRLREEAERLPHRTATPAASADRQTAPCPHGPLVVVVGRRLPRLIAGLTASVLLLAAVVGVAARSALPGGTLYPVKGWMDSVAVQLADSPYQRGLTYIAQATEHIADARTLTRQQPLPPAEVDTALSQAGGSVVGARTQLETSYRQTHKRSDIEPLIDFAARSLPELEAIRLQLPSAALPAFTTLDTLVRQYQNPDAVPILCEPSCPTGSSPSTPSSDGPPTSGTPSRSVTSSSSSSTTGSRGGGASPGVSTLPTVQPPAGGPGPAGGTVGGPRAGVTHSSSGAVVNPPKVTLPRPTLPKVTLPTPTLPKVTLPRPTLPKVTLPTPTLPKVALPAPRLPKVSLPPPRLP